MCIEVFGIKVKLLPESNLGFICDWIWVEPLRKSTITMKEALLRFTVVSFSGELIFNGVQGHFYASIKIAIFKTLPLYTWTLRTLFVFLKRRFLDNSR